MTREEKIYKIKELDSENRDILRVINGFNKNNPNKINFELSRPVGSFRTSILIRDEILMTVVEMLENKIEKNNKRIDELLGVEQ